MLGIIVLIFTTIFLVEIGDKTQISIFLLASKTQKHFQLLVGIILAFCLINGLSVLFASILIKYFSLRIIKIISALIFITFGLFALLVTTDEHVEESQQQTNNPLLVGFSLTAIAEIGDKSQIAMALFAIKFNPLVVFITGILALSSISVLTLYAGRYLCKRINQKLIHRITGILFIIIGILFLF